MGRAGFSTGLGLGLGNSQGFDPVRAFAGAAAGWYYDFTDLSTLFQDTGATMPVTAAADPIGRVNDKSPFGNHSIQATAAARPTWQTSGSLPGAQFDGVDDFLSAGDVCDLRTNSMWAVVAAKFSSTADGGLFAKSLYAAQTGRYALYRDAGGVGGLVSMYGDNPTTASTSGASDTSTAARIFTVRIDRSAGTIKLHRNRLQAGSTTTYTPDVGSDRNTTRRLLHGAYNNSTDTGIVFPFNGRIVASMGVIAPAIDEALIRGVEQAFASNVGVSLP